MPETALLYHRDRRGALQAVLPFSQLEWTHRFAASGGFRLSMPLEAGASVRCGDGIDIELDGRVDFSGVVQSRELAYAPEREPSWELRGLDLTWWLHQRVIVPPAGASHDEQIGVPAETAIRHYIDAHLLRPADPARAIAVAATLAPATLASANKPPLGPPVRVRARYSNLAREVERIAALGDVGFGASRAPDGAIRFGVRAPRDRTAASATPVIISPHLGTAAALSYSEGGAQGRNAVYVLGAGSGAGRVVEVVADADAIAGHGRRESSLDARDAGDRAAARDAGLAELARQAGQSLRVAAVAPGAGPIAYPGDWQVGDRVSIDLPDLELRFDRRVEAVRVRADAGEAIAVDCAFGAPAPDAADTLRRIAERTTPARFA